jgi:hypothetical protein
MDLAQALLDVLSARYLTPKLEVGGGEQSSPARLAARERTMHGHALYDRAFRLTA